MRLTYEASAELLHKFWSGEPVPSPKTGKPMRAFFVERTFAPQVVMIGTKGEHFRFDQKPRQIVFSPSHIKSMVRDAKERESPVCPQDFEPLYSKRIPATRFPGEWDWSFCCPKCLSFGTWEYTDKKDESTVPPTKKKEEAPPFHDETIPLPKRMEFAKTGDLALKLYAAMAQTDCTACGYDCEGYAKAIADGKEKDISLCVPGKAETEDVLKKLVAGTYSFA
jgi:hypothetical protein